MSTFHPLAEHLHLLKTSCSLVLKDEGFQLPTPLAEKALKSAERLLEWLSDAENKEAASIFASNFIGSLKSCFSTYRKARSGREQMWECYYKLRSSERFVTRWAQFLQASVGTEACPIFYQFVTDSIMEVLIKEHFPLEVACSEQKLASLDYEEVNALRYTAGYVIRALRRKIERSAHPLMEELILCLVEMEQNEGTEHESEEWTNAIDRGGLKHVSDMTYMLFVSMELELRQHLHDVSASEDSGMKEKAMEKMLHNEDVLFYWSMISADWEEEGDVLLQMIIEHWVTVCGFSHTSAFLEKYKQANKKTVQKSKGTRKNLLPKINSEN